MRLIYKVIPNSKKHFLKEMVISVVIIVAYSLGVSAYVAMFLLPAYYFAQDQTFVLWPWLSIPAIGMVVGCLHVHYRNKASLKSRALAMFILFLVMFLIPVLILFIV